MSEELIDLTVFGICECNVWELSPFFHDNRCGRCGVKPKRLSMVINTMEEAREIYREEHGVYPEPFEEIYQAATWSETPKVTRSYT